MTNGEKMTHTAEKDRMRGTGGNRFIGTDPTSADLMRSINDQLDDLREWATKTGRVLDLAEVTISTKRIPSGAVSVSVTADLADGPTRVIPPGTGPAMTHPAEKDAPREGLCVCGHDERDHMNRTGSCGYCGAWACEEFRLATEPADAEA